MSRTIDERVVSMQFDNKDFERKASTTLSTLDKLKQKLNLSGAAKGLEEIDSASRKINLSGLSGSVDVVHAKFSALQVMGMTALANIANSAVNAGKRIVESLTIAPVTTGFNEYELKMGSIQTIMASTGESLDTVNSYLNELNEYSDKTIYSFSDMTQNIGKFTNAGVKLEDAVLAIKGISNEAALSGANANEASRAMYNFAQALSAGYVKLIDWKSIENANMATKGFKEQLIETAVSVGTLTKTTDGMYRTLDGTVMHATKNFNESLQDQWMTTDVLVTTLQKYADETTEIGKKAYASAQDVKTFTMMMDTLKESAQSGWAQTWELIFGDFEEAKSLWTTMTTAIGGVIDKTSEARNELLKGALSSKWEQLVEQINAAGVKTEDFESKLKEVAKETGKWTGSYGQSFEDMIKQYGSLQKAFEAGAISTDIVTDSLSRLSKSSGDAATKFEELRKVVRKVMNGEFGNGRKRFEQLTAAGYDYAIVQGLVNKAVNGEEIALESLSEAQKESLGFTEQEIDLLAELEKQAEDTGVPLKDLIENISKPSGRELLLEGFANILDRIKKVLKTVGDAWNEVFPEFSSEDLYSLVEKFHEFSENLALSDEALEKLKNTLVGFFKAIKFTSFVSLGLFEILLNVANKVLQAGGWNLLNLAESFALWVSNTIDWIQKNDKMVEGAKKLVEIVKTAIGTVDKWVKSMFETEKAQTVVTAFTTFVTSTFSQMNEHFNTAINNLGTLIDSWKSMEEIKIEDIPKILEEIGAAIAEFFNLEKLGGIVQTTFSTFKGTAMPILDTIGEKFGWLTEKWDSFKTLLVNSIPTIASVLSALAIIKSLQTLATALELLASPIKAISGAFDGAKKAFTALADSIKAKSWKDKSKAFLVFSAAILVLVGALWLLTKLEKDGNLLASVGILVVMMAALGGLAFAISKIKDLDKVNNVTFLVLALAGSLLALSYCLKMMETMDFAKGLGNVVLLGLLAAGLVLVTKELGKNKKVITKGALSLVGISLAVMLMVKAVKDLDGAQLKDPIGTVVALGIIIAGLKVITAACKGLSFGSAASVIAAVIALKIMIGIFDDIAKVDVNAIVSNIAGYITVFGTFALLMAVSKLAGANAAQAGVGIFAMSLAILVLTKAIKSLAEVNVDHIEKALDAIYDLFSMFASLTVISYVAGPNAAKAGLMILSMAAAMLILTGAIHLLKGIPIDDLKKANGAIIMLGILFGAMMFITKYAKLDKGSTGTIITMAIAIVAMAGAVALLSFIPTDKLITAAASLGILIATFAVLIAATQFIQTAKGTFLKSVGILAALTLIVGALAGIIYSLASIENPNGAIYSASAIAILLSSMAASLAILGLMKPLAVGALGTMGILTAIVLGLSLILKYLSIEDPAAAIGTAVAMSVLLLAMAGTVAILASIGPMAAQALPAVGILAAIMALVGVFLFAMFELAKYSISQLPAMAENLSLFATKLAPFIAAINGLDDSFLSSVKTLTEAILLLTAARFVDGLAKLNPFASSYKDLGTALRELGTAILVFSNNVSGLSEDNIKKIGLAADAAKKIAEFLDVLPSTSTREITKFGSTMTSFGKCLIDYADSIKDLPQDAIAKITTTAAAGVKLAELGNAIPKQDGWAQTIMGKQDLESFGEKIAAFAESLVGFAEKSKGLDKTALDAIDTAVASATKLTDLTNSLPKNDGVWQTIAGEKDIATFGEKIVAFAQCLYIFSCVASPLRYGFVTDSINTAIAAGTKLSDLAKAIPESGLAKTIMGKQDIEEFGAKIEKFAFSLVEFAGWASELTPGSLTAIDTAIAATEKLVSLSTALTGLDGGGFSNFVEELFGADDTSTFGRMLKDLGSALYSYSSSLVETDLTKINSATSSLSVLIDIFNRMTGRNFEGVSNFAKALNELGEVSVDDFVNAFLNADSKIANAVASMLVTITNTINSSSTNIATAANEMIAEVLNVINLSKTKFKMAGDVLITFFKNGFEEKRTVVDSSIQTILNGLVTIVNGKYTEFYTSGQYLAQGLADGISAQSWAVEAASRSVMSAAIAAAKEAAGINSPSKETYKLGGFFGDGFVNALYDTVSRVYKAGASMADAAISGVSNAMSVISDVMSTDSDINPTISPVVDMSNIKTIAGDIQFDANISTLLGKPVDSLSQIMASAQSDILASNMEVANAVNGLREDLNLLYSTDQEVALYVDSKKLATSLAKPMNRQLNILSKRGAY